MATQQEEATLTTTQGSLTLTDFGYEETYRLTQGSASQVVRGMKEMLSRVGEITNDYQRILYPVLTELTNGIVDRYTELLKYSSDKEKEIVQFNLHGYDGTVRGNVATKGVNYILIYKYANFGDFIKTIRQRLEFITSRSTPKRYLEDEEKLRFFVALKDKINEFLRYLKDDVDPRWNTTVAAARTSGGDEVQDNLKKREEEAKERREAKEKALAKKAEQTQQRTNRPPRTFNKPPRDGDNQRAPGGFRGGRGGFGRGAFSGRGNGRPFNNTPFNNEGRQFKRNAEEENEGFHVVDHARRRTTGGPAPRGGRGGYTPRHDGPRVVQGTGGDAEYKPRYGRK
jgi:hypothetical protein